MKERQHARTQARARTHAHAGMHAHTPCEDEDALTKTRHSQGFRKKEVVSCIKYSREFEQLLGRSWDTEFRNKVASAPPALGSSACPRQGL